MEYTCRVTPGANQGPVVEIPVFHARFAIAAKMTPKTIVTIQVRFSAAMVIAPSTSVIPANLFRLLSLATSDPPVPLSDAADGPDIGEPREMVRDELAARAQVPGEGRRPRFFHPIQRQEDPRPHVAIRPVGHEQPIVVGLELRPPNVVSDPAVPIIAPHNPLGH